MTNYFDAYKILYRRNLVKPQSFQLQFEGLTGPIQFAESKRSNFKLDLMKLKSHSIDKVGEWTPKDGLNVTDRYAFQHGRNFKLGFIIVYYYTLMT